VAAFIESGQFAVHLRSMRRAYHARAEALAFAAQRHLAGTLDVRTADAGLHTTGHLRIGVDEADVSGMAAAQGITLTPLSRFCVAPTEHRGFMLGFAVANEQEIRKAIHVLANVIEEIVDRRAKARRAVARPA
jgi:GntR family transcriptional regulator/MocR family aminotransferase